MLAALSVLKNFALDCYLVQLDETLLYLHRSFMQLLPSIWIILHWQWTDVLNFKWNCSCFEIVCLLCCVEKHSEELPFWIYPVFLNEFQKKKKHLWTINSIKIFMNRFLLEHTGMCVCTNAISSRNHFWESSKNFAVSFWIPNPVFGNVHYGFIIRSCTFKDKVETLVFS